MVPSSIFKVFYFYSASILRSSYLSFWSLSFWQSPIRTLVILLSSPGCPGRSPHLKILTATTSAVWPNRQHFYWLPGLGRGHYSANHRGYCLVTKSCLSLCNTMVCKTCQASQSFTISRGLLKFTSIESVMPSNHLILSHPFSSCLQSFPALGSFPMSQLFESVSRFSDSFMFDSLQSHGLQHTSLLCPSSTPTAWSNSCPLSRWCHQVAKVLELQLQHQSFQWIFRVDFL